MTRSTLLPVLAISLMIASSLYPFTHATSTVNSEKTTFPHIVFVTYDGARKYWVDALMANGSLPHLSSLCDAGAEITLRITDHNPSTDPCMACIESGYGPTITGINQNYFASMMKPSIPDGLTISERIKATYGAAWQTALVMPWTQDTVNVTTTRDSTFWNQRAETDYWFSSENVTWSEHDPAVWKNALSFSDALLRANYTASRVADFIQSAYASPFYVRTHFVEPDYVGHGYRESVDNQISPQYKQALIACDEALGIIIDALMKKGIYEETVILVSTDHGFKGLGHGPPTYPLGDPDVTETWLISNDPEVTNALGWGLQNDMAPTCLELAGIDPDALQPFYNLSSKALPLWKASLATREMTPPTIVGVTYPESIREDEAFQITVEIHDPSGINAAHIRYIYGTIWRTNSLIPETETTYRGALGPFVKGTEVAWYLRVVDDSPSLNVAYYPEDRMALTYTVEEATPTDTASPIISNVTYSTQVKGGEAFTLSATIQDSSGIATADLYFHTNGVWQVQGLTATSEGLYSGSVGPFDSGTLIQWYLNVTDNSVNHNVAVYPSDGEPLLVTVKTEENPESYNSLLIGGAVALAIALAVAYWLYRR